MDGFSKIPGFIAPTLRERIARGASIASTAMLPALFLAFLARWHRGELAYAYQDGVMDPATAHAIFAAPDPVAAFCRDPLLWGRPRRRSALWSPRFARRTGACRPSFEATRWHACADDWPDATPCSPAPAAASALPSRRPTSREGARCTAVDLAPQPGAGCAALVARHARSAALRRAPTSRASPRIDGLVGGAARALRHRRRAVQQRRGVRPGAAARIATKPCTSGCSTSTSRACSS